MKKFYAVKVGRRPGIYEDWPSCEQQVKGYANAAFKGFTLRTQAEQWLNGATELSPKDVGYPKAYVDGSFDVRSGRFSFGAVILHDAESLEMFSDCFEDAVLSKLHNVAGELKGSMFAISYAVSKGWPHLTLYYDYTGIEKWALGEWKRNLSATRAYYAFCQEAFQKIDVTFIKVKGHSGDKFNEMADNLARGALLNDRSE